MKRHGIVLGLLAALAMIFTAMWVVAEEPADQASTRGQDPCKVHYADFGAAFMDKYCLSCHHSEKKGFGRKGAPKGYDFDDVTVIVKEAKEIVEEVVVRKDMPPTFSKKPTDEERAHHYLWRFWRHLTRAGRFLIFDRSWYGRVLVERVESFASESEWRRAFAEINDFEKQIVDHGIVLVKFWLHISPEEQERRFQARTEIPYKRWKLTDEDWRNREKWEEYEIALHDMIERTSTQVAPWILVEGNDKRFARIKVLKQVCKYLGEALDSK